jgi:acyl-CoA synthetase (NDP forming)
MRTPSASHNNAEPFDLNRLLRPRSIALVGASESPGSLGESLLTNIERAEFPGELYLVNPRRERIRGRACLASVDALPEGVDCAVLAIPGAAVVDAAAACARRNVASLIVFSAGFAESGEAGRGAQEQLAEIAHRNHMAVEGPNCLGLVNYVDGIPLTFIRTQIGAPAHTPAVAVLSQSGALAAVLGVNLLGHGLRISYSISTGNEAVCGVGDFIEHLLEDEHTQVFAMIVEQFRQPRRFLALAAKARALGKFIVLLHPGSSAAARASAVTHTGAMAGDYAVMRTKVARAGVVLVETLEELTDVAQLLIRCPALPRAGAAVFAESGAFKALALDFCERVGLDLPELPEPTAAALRTVLPSFIAPSNPMDLTAHGLVDPDLYRRTLAPILAEERFGSVVLAIILTDRATCDLKFPPILDALRTLTPTQPVIFAALDEGASAPAAYIEQLRELGVSFFPSPERALRALARITSAGEQQARLVLRSGGPSDLPPLDGVLPEYRAKQLLAQFGIPVPEGALARTLEEARAIATRIGYPVALKVQSCDLSHKTDAGAVALNIGDEDALAAAWERVCDNVAQAKPGLPLDGVLVERMAQPGTELIAGARNDPEWGPVLLVGFGGVLAEALRDVRLLPPDLSVDEIAAELGKLQCSALLRRFRGSPALDVEAAAKIVFAVGELISGCPAIREIDINPIVVYAEGKGAIALDALIVADSSAASQNSIVRPT